MSLYNEFGTASSVEEWDPEFEMPTIPNLENIDYTGKSAEWYLSAESNLSKSLIEMSR